MFARNVSIRLKPNSSAAFTKLIESETIPMLRKQAGFEGEVTFLASGGADAIAISFWNNKESADAYARNGYPDVLNTLNQIRRRYSEGSDLRSCSIRRSTRSLATVAA